MIMMFNDNDRWGSNKVNFVDSNNVFVGYDLEQSCCENADWFLADSIAEDIPSDLDQSTDLKDYVFVEDFFEEVDLKGDEHGYSDLGEGGMVAFKLINTDGKEKYLHLYNCHNGYYGHGFEVKHNGVVVDNGTL